MEENQTILETLHKVGAFLVEQLREELRLQGHEATGNLMSSLEYKIIKDVDGFELNIYMNGYGLFVEQGVDAKKIPYRRGSGAESSKYINALIQWIQQKGLESGDSKIKSFAFAIAEKHKREGMSTLSSRRFSKTGKRDEFIEDVLNQNSFEVGEEIRDAFEKDIDIFLDNLIKKAETEEA